MASSSIPAFAHFILGTSVNQGSIRAVEPILKKLLTSLKFFVFKENENKYGFVNNTEQLYNNHVYIEFKQM